MQNCFDITELEEQVKMIVERMGFTRKVYSNRPKAALQLSDFAVVEVDSTVEDEGAYGRCTVSVSLFANDVNERKNNAKLSYMQHEFMSHFPASYGKYIFDDYPSVLGDTPDDFGFHARIIQVKTLIKATQHGNTN